MGDEAEQATRLAEQGKWQAAVEIIDRLGATHGADPTLVYNRTVLGGWLADDRALVAGLHAYAQFEVPLDDAVEAEAIAQLLDPEAKEDRSIRLRRCIRSAISTRLSSGCRPIAEHSRSTSTRRNVRRQRSTAAAQTYVLLDRPLPTSGAEITRDEVPSLAGVVAIFGRQTNREERLELTTDHGPAFDKTVAALAEICGDTIGEMSEEQSGRLDHADRTGAQLALAFPDRHAAALRRQLIDEQRHVAIVERWPKCRGRAWAAKRRARRRAIRNCEFR